jgi:hypothetical protein
MVAGFTMLLAKIAASIQWLGLLAVAVFVAGWDFIRDAATWPFEQIMSIVVSAAGGVPIPAALTTNLSAWGSIPAEVLNILGLLQVGTAIAIIAAAIGVRLILQMIPFVRFGS